MLTTYLLTYLVSQCMSACFSVCLDVDSGYIHIDTSTSLSLVFVYISYKLHRHEWSIRGRLYKHMTQRVSIDNLQ